MNIQVSLKTIVNHIHIYLFNIVLLISIHTLLGCKQTSNTSDTPSPAVDSDHSNQPNPSADFNCISNPVAKGSRELGMDILNYNSSRSYSVNLADLKSMNASYQTLHLEWSAIEGSGSGTTSGTFSDPNNALSAFDSIAVSQNIKLNLTIRPIDTTKKSVPSDLNSTRFNSNIMSTRFNKMIDYVLTRINKNNLVVIMVGNEIDGYNPGSDSNFWSDYGAFLFNVKSYVSTNYPGLKVGFTGTHSAFTDSTKTLALGANSVAVMNAYANTSGGVVDVVGVTYYPLDNSFKMKDPNVVQNDFNHLDDFTSKPIFIQEIGFSTSQSTNGSDIKQAEFFCEAFKAWDSHKDGIPKMAILRMNDITRVEADAMATGPGGYGLAVESFIEYLRTLGLYNYDGSAKSAYGVIKKALSDRGF